MPVCEQETSLFPSDLLQTPEVPCGGEPRRGAATVVGLVYQVSSGEIAGPRSVAIPDSLLSAAGEDEQGVSQVEGVDVHPFVFRLCVSFGSDEERGRSLTTNRLSRILAVGDGDSLLHDLRQLQLLIASGLPLTLERRLAPGVRVRVRRGPLEGLEGTVLERRGQTRLLVSVNFLQQGASIDIDDFMLERLEQAPSVRPIFPRRELTERTPPTNRGFSPAPQPWCRQHGFRSRISFFRRGESSQSRNSRRYRTFSLGHCFGDK